MRNLILNFPHTYVKNNRFNFRWREEKGVMAVEIQSKDERIKHLEAETDRYASHQ